MSTSPTTRETVAQFIGGFGVNTHLGRSGTAYASGDATILNDLGYIGVTKVRDNLSATGSPSFADLAGKGIKFDLVAAVGGTVSLSSLMSQYDAFVAHNPGALTAVEGANEVNQWPVTYNGQSGMGGAGALQAALYSAVKGDGALAGVPVYNTTLGGGSEQLYSQLSSIAASSSDDVNDHLYPQGAPPSAYLSANIPWEDPGHSGKPLVITETGYYSMPDSNYGVDQHVQAVYTLDLLLDAAAQGSKATYLYELMDDYADPNNTNMEDHFGLFNNDGSPKPVATALHNLTTILNAGGASGNAVNPSFAISGQPSSGNSINLTKPDGAADLVIWAEPQIWNQSSDSEVAPGTANVTVSLGATYQAVALFDPLSGTSPLRTLSNVSSVALAVTDHPMIVEVEPQATGSVPSGGSAGGGSSSTPSPNGAKITSPSSAPIIDAKGNSWTLIDGGTSLGYQVAANGNVDAGTNHVTLLEYLNGAIVQENSAGNWYSEPGPSGPWSQIANPTLPAASDTLALRMSEDAYQGDAQFTVSMDGKLVGGTYTASALHSSGDSGLFLLTGNWGTGAHQVAISFLNDLYAGTPSTDRNLYVDSVAYDGQTYADTTAPVYASSPRVLAVGGSTPGGTTPADTLTMHLSEDAWNGNADFTLAIDGKSVSTPQGVTALHSTGQWADITFTGNFGAGSHTVGVSFVNDAYGGTPTTDRNLYINGIDCNGTHYGSGVTTMLSNGTTSFAIATSH